MHKRENKRQIPTTPRYFQVQTSVGAVDFRLPSYQRMGRLLTLTREASGEGIDRMVEILDAVGLTIGHSWCHVDYDLESGDPPPIDDAGAWRSYGEMVVDECQEMGMHMGDLFAFVQSFAELAGAQLAMLGEAKAEGNGSSETTVSLTSSPSMLD